MIEPPLDKSQQLCGTDSNSRQFCGKEKQEPVFMKEGCEDGRIRSSGIWSVYTDEDEEEEEEQQQQGRFGVTKDELFGGDHARLSWSTFCTDCRKTLKKTKKATKTECTSTSHSSLSLLLQTTQRKACKCHSFFVQRQRKPVVLPKIHFIQYM